MKNFIAFLFLFSLCVATTFAQRDLEKELNQYVNPDELVSLSQFLSFDAAIEVLNTVSEKLTGQRIVSTYKSEEAIGIEIDKIPYKKALLMIVRFRGLIFEEKPDVIVVKVPGEPEKVEPLPKEIYASVGSREVKISVIFFEADAAKSKDIGINWQAILSDGSSSFGGDMKTFGQNIDDPSKNPSDFNFITESKFDLGDFSANILGVFRFFESNNIGEIIASPSIVVRDKQEGKIQIGSDFSIKQRDFAGNVTDQFFATGSIIKCTPYVYSEDDLEYILLKLNVERSSFFPSDVTTEVRKTSAETEVLMLNGEETVIGGLFINDETKVRTGIPFLKDLPWWVLGIRYLTGSDQIRVTKKEIIIVIKAELLPTLQDRFDALKSKNVVRDKQEQNRNDLNRIKTQTYKLIEEEEKEQ